MSKMTPSWQHMDKKKQNGVYTVKKGRTGEQGELRNSLRPLEAMVKSWPLLLPGATSGSFALQQEGSVTTRGHGDIPGMGCLLEQC